MGACETHSKNTSAKYYFNEVQDAINGSEMGPQQNRNDITSMEQRVTLNVSLKNIDTNNLYQVELIIYSDSQRKAYKSAGVTEKLSRNQSNNEINFQQFFALPYFFEKQQLLDFKIFNGGNSEILQSSLGSIMGSRKQILIKKLPDGVDIVIKGRENKKSNKLISFYVNLNGNFSGMGLSYSIINQGTDKNPSNMKLYDSETLSAKTKQINFAKCAIPAMLLDVKNNTICIEVKDLKHKATLGKYLGSVSELLNPTGSTVNLAHNNMANIKCNLESKPSFIAYLHSGMVINLTIGIDFTGSNGAYTNKLSLHFLQNGMNDYEKAIRSCGDILAYYDYDQLFPVFGFGFRFNGYGPQFTQKYGQFNFPINCNINNPEIHTIDNVLMEYRNFIPKIQLWGPTNFAPLINDLNNEAKENLRREQIMSYNILMILTDGQIDDMNDTINALVEASFLPISVIIVGIGNGNFGNMDILDADEHPLYDKNCRKADRDLVQFVPFNNFKNDPQKLAEQVLEEIPRQVVEYFQHRKIQPIADDEDNDTAYNSNYSTDFNSGVAPTAYGGYPQM